MSVKNLYRNNPNPIGSGSTAAALRHKTQTGLPVKGKDHLIKTQQYPRALEEWISKNPNASRSDIQAAENILRDMKNALRERKSHE